MYVLGPAAPGLKFADYLHFCGLASPRLRSTGTLRDGKHRHVFSIFKPHGAKPAEWRARAETHATPL